MCGPAAGSVAEARQEEFLMRVLIVGLSLLPQSCLGLNVVWGILEWVERAWILLAQVAAAEARLAGKFY